MAAIIGRGGGQGFRGGRGQLGGGIQQGGGALGQGVIVEVSATG